MRREFEMSDIEREEIIAASAPVPYLVIGGQEPRSQQERANDAWAALGRNRGFDHMTVKPVPGKPDRFFSAELATNPGPMDAGYRAPPPEPEPDREEAIAAELEAAREAAGAAVGIVADPGAGSKLAEYSKTAAGLAELRGRLAKVVYDLTTTKGMEAARADRRECVKLRTSLEALRVELKAPALERSRLIDSEAKTLTAAILELERPIDDAIQAAEAAKEEARRAKAAAETVAREAEAARIAGIRDRLATLARFPAEAIALDSAGILARREELATTPEGWAESFGEFAEEARASQRAGLEFLDELARKRRATEEESARVAAAAAELAEAQERDRQERAARDTQERQEREAREAADKAARDAQEAVDAAAREELAARERAVREAEERQEAERQRLAREEEERIERCRVIREGLAARRAQEYAGTAAARMALEWVEAREPTRGEFRDDFDDATVAWVAARAFLLGRIEVLEVAEAQARQEAEQAAEARQRAAEEERRQAAERERQEAAERAAEHRRQRLADRAELRTKLGIPEAALAEVAAICDDPEIADADARCRCLIIAEAFTITEEAAR